MKNKLLNGLLIAVLVLLVPYLIGRVSIVILERVYPTVEEPASVKQCKEEDRDKKALSLRNLECLELEGAYLRRSLDRTRSIARTALILVGVYYLGLIAVWFIRRRSRRTKDVPDASEVSI